MLINNSFDVPLPPAQAWTVLMDIPRIAPCLPGAELTGVVDANTYNGKVSVRLGPVALIFAGTVKFTEKDESNHRARVFAQGKDSKGRGGAHANVDFNIEPVAGGSRVLVRTDLMLSGAVAQYGRASGLIQDVAQQLIGQFANALKAQLAAAQPAAPEPVESKTADSSPKAAAKKPTISAFSLLSMLISALFRRLSGSGKT